MTTFKDRSMFRARVTLGLFVVLCAGCADRTYLTKSHGRAYDQAFGRQVANPDPHPKASRGDATQGLDSQEASAVAGAYRRSLRGKEGGGDSGAAQPMVIMNPGAGQQTSYMPPPSVPTGP
jgi:hypothetical protein